MTAHLLRLLMKSHGLTPPLLAARAGVRQPALEAILAGAKTPSTREAKQLADFFRIDLTDLVALPTPSLDGLPEWQKLSESLFQHGRRYGWKPIQDYLVVMTNAWGRELARLKLMERRAQ